MLNNTFSTSSVHTQQNIASMIRQGGTHFLLKLKHKAIRINNSWFKTLSLDKRRFIDAVIQTVDRIQSSLLLKLMTELAEKLLRAIGGMPALIGNIRCRIINYGVPLAQKISCIAQKWGYKKAVNWVANEDFARYLAVMEINNNSMFRVSGNL
jgi:hypothetical protein